MALQNRRLSHYLWHSRRRTCYSSADNWSQTRNIRELRKGRLLSLLFFVATMSQHVSQVKVAMGQPQLSYKGSLRDEVKLKHAKRRLKRTKEEADKTIFQIIAIKFLLKNRNWPSEQIFCWLQGKNNGSFVAFIRGKRYIVDMVTPQQALEIFRKRYPKTRVLWIREHKDFYSFARQSEDGHNLITGGTPVVDKNDGSMYGLHLVKHRNLLMNFKKIDI